jgi:AmmeMemoRadiSam system protein B
MNPLWFLGAMFAEQPQLVVATIGPGVTRSECVALGRLLSSALETSGRRVAFVASVDLAHAHDQSGPFGFEPDAAACDAAVVDALRGGDLSQLVDVDPEAAARARTEAVEPLLVLHGLVDGGAVRAEVLSYEAPTYFDMAVAEFTPLSP